MNVFLRGARISVYYAGQGQANVGS